MLGHNFYHGLIKKYLVYFGSLFNSVYISRTDSSGNEIERMKVPLAYSAKDKLIARTRQDPAIQKKAAVTLPRMGFELVNLNYDANRKLNRVGKVVQAPGVDANHFKVVYQPVAYDFSLNLYICVKNSEDGTKIIEQILPFFTPDFTVTAAPGELIPDLNFPIDLPTVYTGMNILEEFEGPIKERQVLIYTINFTLKGYLWGPVLNKPIIKFVEAFAHMGNGVITDAMHERVAVYPGLDANGNPTSNGVITINANLINFDDDYGYIVVRDSDPFTPNLYPFTR